MSPKKKINTASYNLLETFVVDMTVDETARLLDASEKDVSQISSKILEEDDTDILIRLSYVEMGALFVIVKPWARGTLAQVSIFRSRTKYTTPSSPSPSPLIKRTTKKKIASPIVYIMMFSVSIAICLGILSMFPENRIRDLIFPMFLVISFIFVVLIVAVRLSMKSSDANYHEITIPHIAKRPVKRPSRITNQYEKLLLKYVMNKLEAHSTDDVFNENYEDYKHLKRRNNS